MNPVVEYRLSPAREKLFAFRFRETKLVGEDAHRVADLVLPSITGECEHRKHEGLIVGDQFCAPLSRP